MSWGDCSEDSPLGKGCDLFGGHPGPHSWEPAEDSKDAEIARLKALLKRTHKFLFAATGFDSSDDEQRDLRKAIEALS